MAKFDWKRKDIRALPANVMARVIGSVLPAGTAVRVGGLSELRGAAASGRLVAPDDEVTRAVCAAAGIGNRVELRNAFLRWNSSKLTKPMNVDAVDVSEVDLPDLLAWSEAVSAAWQSSDWWRRVGAVAARDGHVLLVGHNRHLPHELTPYVFGDPRMFAKQGVAIEISTALHAEAGVIAGAAALGMCLRGSDLYVTTFPCPPCAKLVAAAGVNRLYFRDGYGILDAETVLKSAGVELFRVITQ
jgi:dCMP deaminase